MGRDVRAKFTYVWRDPVPHAMLREWVRVSLPKSFTWAREREGETLASRDALSELEPTVAGDAEKGKAAVGAGGVHPLTSRTAGYIRRLFEYEDALQTLFHDPGEVRGAGGRCGRRGKG